MKSLRTLLAAMVVASGFSLLLGSTPASALSCSEPPPLSERYEDYDALVVGRVTEVIEENRDDKRLLTVEVKHQLKGEVPSLIQMEESATWGPHSVPDGVYRVYPLKRKADRLYQFGLCSYSMDWNEKTQAELKAVGYQAEDPTAPLPEEKVAKDLETEKPDYSAMVILGLGILLAVGALAGGVWLVFFPKRD